MDQKCFQFGTLHMDRLSIEATWSRHVVRKNKKSSSKTLGTLTIGRLRISKLRISNVNKRRTSSVPAKSGGLEQTIVGGYLQALDFPN